MRGSAVTYWRSMAGGRQQGAAGRLIRLVLLPAALIYGLVLRLRSAAYRRGVFRSRSLPRPVVSIGNITVGGTGKTPITALVARFLLARGVKVAVLSRGYSGKLEGKAAVVSDGSRILLTAEECGDEPFLLASTVPGLAVVIGADRYAAGQLALQTCSPDLFLLDDGFQHLRLRRDLDILLLDAVRPFGNGWCLPAGLLREPRQAATRADLVIFTRCPRGETPISPLPDKPLCRAWYELDVLCPLTGGSPIRLDNLRGRKVAAFCGIAEPDYFFASLRGAGLSLAATHAYRDHEPYDTERIAELEAFIAASGAEFVLTTEKDGVKLGRLASQYAAKTLTARLEVTLDDTAPLQRLLCNLL